MKKQQSFDCFVGAPTLQTRSRTRTTSLHRVAKRSDLSASCYEGAERFVAMAIAHSAGPSKRFELQPQIKICR